MPKKLTLTGRTFGSITVRGAAGTSKKGESLWHCTCGRCGAEFVAVGHRLTAKKPITDCGCSFRERAADLTGKSLGALTVLRRDGSYSSGDAAYICRCGICGGEKRFPACTIRTKPKSCGCVKTSREKLSEMAAKGAAATCRDGVQLYSATREAANANSSTGLRWVHVLNRPSGTFIYAAFYIRGQKYYKGGFSSPESAHAWAAEEHKKILNQEGIHRPSPKGEQK